MDLIAGGGPATTALWAPEMTGLGVEPLGQEGEGEGDAVEGGDGGEAGVRFRGFAAWGDGEVDAGEGLEVVVLIVAVELETGGGGDAEQAGVGAGGEGVDGFLRMWAVRWLSSNVLWSLLDCSPPEEETRSKRRE